MKQIQLKDYLTWAGTLPFIAALSWQAMDASRGQGNFVFIAYGAIILSFMAGASWGAVVAKQAESQNSVALLLTNLLALLAVSGLLFHSLSWSLFILALGFVLIYLLDRKLAAQALISEQYLRLRFAVTTLVVILHLALYAVNWSQLH